METIMPNAVPAAGHRLPAPSSLICYQTLPPGCIAFLVKDDYSAPYIRAGEWVVVDTTDRTARVGDVYVIHWDSGGRNLCQARHSSKMWQPDGKTPCWHVGSLKTSSKEEFDAWLKQTEEARAHGAIPTWRGGWTEGPLNLDHLESKLVGAVIGLYQPTFDSPLRIAG
ncbi:S24 family peptidase [Rhizobium flavescens]|uniref:S24 family peptidase n=2 Tax=Rhizobium TaxID=379 RepID=UPI0014083C10|nr:S24/S26 family peptidase [Rhizobium flavescens]